MRKLNKAVAKKERDAADRIRENKPTYKLDHIVRERWESLKGSISMIGFDYKFFFRYPSFIDAIRDLDDALTLCFLFARLPKSPKVKSEFSQLCRRLSGLTQWEIFLVIGLFHCFYSFYSRVYALRHNFEVTAKGKDEKAHFH